MPRTKQIYANNFLTCNIVATLLLLAMGLKDMLNAFKSLQIEAETVRIIERRSSTDEIKRLNKEQLYNFGVGSDGIKLKKYLSKYYAKEKNFDNPRPGFGFPDLYLTGAFHRGFFTSVGPNSIEISSKDKKRDKLVADYGENIFGLTKTNSTYFAIRTVRPEVLKYVERVTGLKAT